jgi:hypothetical protein
MSDPYLRPGEHIRSAGVINLPVHRFMQAVGRNLHIQGDVDGDADLEGR